MLGENRAEDWAPEVTWHYRPTDFWWWLDPDADPGHRIVAPDHALFPHIRPKDVIWHYHGLLDVPEGARSLIDIVPSADPEGRGGSILYEHPNVMGSPGRLIVTCLDPVSHHGSFFMPAASRFLTGLLDWMDAEFGAPQGAGKVASQRSLASFHGAGSARAASAVSSANAAAKTAST